MCITIAANIAETAILTYPACFPDSVVGFVADPDKCDVVFVEYMFRLLRRQIQIEASGSVQDNINLETLGRLWFPLPPVSEQRAIVHILGTLDDKIELNRRMNETLEAMARALFQSWFVDFDPVRTKAAGHKPPGLDAETAALFPASFQDSPLGKIPKGWNATILGEVLSVIETGGRPTGGIKDIAEGVPSVGAESIVGLGRFDYGKTRFVPREFFGAMKRGHVLDGDVLLYKDGGRPGEFEPHVTMVGDGFPFSEFCINEHVYRLRTEPAIPQSYLFFWLSSESAMEEMRTRGTGVAIPGLNSTALRALGMLQAPGATLRAFDERVGPLVHRILANCNESHILAAIRDALLPKLLSGEIRVKDAEKAVEERA
jgi:type I restriction enzyme S subunit